MRNIISPHKSGLAGVLTTILLFSLLFTGCGSQNADESSSEAISLELIAKGLTSPLTLVESPDESGRIFIVDQIGLIYILSPEGTLLEEPFLDLRDQIVNLNEGYDERGLLGLAFHPNYAENGRFFVYYSAPLRPEAPDDFNHTSHISEFQVSENNPNRADPASEQILLQVDQPQSNHNGGTLAFGPEDGYLYISLGDGGAANDVGLGHVEDWYDTNDGGNGQDITQNLLGSILRIDVDSGDPYGIPPDNPFVDGEGLDEIYAYGFRNPYRFSFDMGGNHELFAGDAGQELWEEVSIVTKGGNYGWNVKEGTHCFDAENPTQVPDNCPDTVNDGPRAGDLLIDPIIEFKNGSPPEGLGISVIGGYVYRGDLLPQLQGEYIFGAWSTSFSSPDGAVFKAEPQNEGLWDFQRLDFANPPGDDLQHFVLGFGQDSEGEVYILTTDNTGPTGNTGKVFKLVEAN
ncbi:MAG TPA: PQQ-dependent sugar dehydrogenase [Balneolaceae bacterium]